MTSYEVKVTKQAYEQMKEIALYITNELPPEAAANLLDKIQEAISALTDMPKRHSLVDEEPWKSKGIFSCPAYCIIVSSS